jgi:hypothetical protein
MKDQHLKFFLLATGASVISETPLLGQITVANSSMNYAGSFAETVTGYLAGLPSDDETESLEAACPSIRTNDFFRFPKADDEAYLTETDGSDIRARGASFKRVQYKGTQVADETQQKGLTMRVDHKDLAKDGGVIIPGWENMYAMELRKRLVRADKFRFIALLDAAANNTAVTFSAATNPDGLLRAQAKRTRTATGIASIWSSAVPAFERKEVTTANRIDRSRRAEWAGSSGRAVSMRRKETQDFRPRDARPEAPGLHRPLVPSVPRLPILASLSRRPCGGRRSSP